MSIICIAFRWPVKYCQILYCLSQVLFPRLELGFSWTQWFLFFSVQLICDFLFSMSQGNYQSLRNANSIAFWILVWNYIMPENQDILTNISSCSFKACSVLGKNNDLRNEVKKKYYYWNREIVFPKLKKKVKKDSKLL